MKKFKYGIKALKDRGGLRSAFEVDKLVMDHEKGRLIGYKYKKGKSGPMYKSLTIGRL